MIVIEQEIINVTTEWEQVWFILSQKIPQEICGIDDELKAIYHSKDTVCIWAFKTKIDRNKFMDETA